MSKITQEELDVMTERHTQWLSEKEGTRLNLTGKDLSGLDFRERYLPSAILHKCNLTGAKMAGVNLNGSNLSNSDFTDADLTSADLTWAVMPKVTLRRTNLTKTNLTRAHVTKSTIDQVDLTHTKLYKANLSETELSSVTLPEVVMVVPDIRQKVLAAIEANPGCAINMMSWHDCETVHCLAGWLVHIHPQGRKLERVYDTAPAAAFILHASGEKIPDFFDVLTGCNGRAMNWLRTGQQVDFPELTDAPLSVTGATSSGGTNDAAHCD